MANQYIKLLQLTTPANANNISRPSTAPSCLENPVYWPLKLKTPLPLTPADFTAAKHSLRKNIIQTRLDEKHNLEINAMMDEYRCRLLTY